VTGRNGGRARVGRLLIVRSQIHADLCTDLAGCVGKQASDLCRPVLFGAQNATICAPKLVITEELPATHISGYLKPICQKPDGSRVLRRRHVAEQRSGAAKFEKQQRQGDLRMVYVGDIVQVTCPRRSKKPPKYLRALHGS